MSTKTIPSFASQTLTVFHYELLKSLRVKKVVAILAITLTISSVLVAIPYLTDSELPDDVRVYFAGNANFLFFLLVISAAFFGSNALVSEFHEKTGYSLFPNPISRKSIWLGKFFAAQLVGVLVILCFFVFLYINAASSYDSVPIESLSILGYSIVVMSMLLAISFLFSSIARGPTSSAVLFFVVFAFALPMADSFMIVADIKPWFTPSFVGEIVEFGIYEPYPLDLIPGTPPRGPYDHHLFVPYIDESLAVIGAYIIGSSILSIFIFEKREMI